MLVFALPGHSLCENGADNTTARYTLKDGKCMAYYCKSTNEPIWLGDGGNHCEGMCSSGDTQDKYTACDTEKCCTYTTQTRTCCSDGSWPDWGKECPDYSSCASNQCWNGSTCVNKGAVSRNCSGNVTNATGGTQTRTATCTDGSGWTYSSWSGTCTCKTGYKWSPSGSCITPPSPEYINCGVSGTSLTVSGRAYSSGLEGTPYNSDYYYNVNATVTFTGGGGCSGTTTVSGRISISRNGGYFSSNLSVSRPSNCSGSSGYLSFRCDRVSVTSKGWN